MFYDQINMDVTELPSVERVEYVQQHKVLHGVDLFLDWDPSTGSPDELAAKLQAVVSENPDLELRLITNRGVKVWPEGYPETFCTDHWRCRFRPRGGLADGEVSRQSVAKLLTSLVDNGLDVIKSENLYLFDGEKGFSLGQGE